LIGKCDYIFAPAVASLGGKAYNCSKMIGLPDILRALIPEAPTILAPEINLDKGRYHFYRNIYKLGCSFTSNPFKIKKATEEAWKEGLAYRRKMSEEKVTPHQVLATIHKDTVNSSLDTTRQLLIAVIGHPYILYDDYLNHHLISRLESMGAKVVTPEMIAEKELDAATGRLAGGSHWSFENEIIGAGEYYLQAKVDGIVCASAFACGPDSMMVGLLQHRIKELGMPFLALSLDEHASEGALLTRLEAFLDMIKRRRKRCE
jgi:predicted nucleotide-binding protein (sugar kinase/HSP70/actin superfamily)